MEELLKQKRPETLKRKRPDTARQYVLNILRNEILDGVHPSGEQLRQEAVAGRLGVSTTPVREAFRDLLSEGLVGADNHRGVLVRGLTLSDAREVFDMRIALEPLLTSRAIGLTTNDKIDEAARLHRKLLAEKDPNKWSILNVEFHNVLTSSVPSGRLTAAVESLGRAAGAYVHLSIHILPAVMQWSNDDHATLIEAFREGDRVTAERVSREHIERTLSAILEGVSWRGEQDMLSVA